MKFENSNPKIIIEVTNYKNEIKGESLAYKTIKLKEAFPDVKIIVVIPDNMVNAGIIALKNECDYVVFNKNINSLISILKKI